MYFYGTTTSDRIPTTTILHLSKPDLYRKILGQSVTITLDQDSSALLSFKNNAVLSYKVCDK
ncbi:MAG: hypothetical protein PHY15_10515, partial [Eubacteriales bacterium]|nr:hypothetical protein [Eubacteriales bacterium]MDD4476529.1 hypothetical protein [Eubacteriales bacterium]